MDGGSRVLKSLFGALLFVGFICFLLFGMIANGEIKTTIRIPSNENLKHLKLTGTKRLTAYEELNLNYASKRRVPNGPDPVHNRRAGKSGQPPDRA